MMEYVNSHLSYCVCNCSVQKKQNLNVEVPKKGYGQDKCLTLVLLGTYICKSSEIITKFNILLGSRYLLGTVPSSALCLLYPILSALSIRYYDFFKDKEPKAQMFSDFPMVTQLEVKLGLKPRQPSPQILRSNWYPKIAKLRWHTSERDKEIKNYKMKAHWMKG